VRYLSGVETLLILLDGRSHTCYGKKDVNGFRFVIDDHSCMFTADYDPTVIRLTTSGKLVRYLIGEGEHVTPGTSFAEIEVCIFFSFFFFFFFLVLF
jgi:acetyl-CoA carboxylase / biotin carboxylase 1